MSRIILFDLDGTLANIEHRVHLLNGTNDGWRAFYAACPSDERIDAVYQAWIAFGMRTGIERWVVSGRSDEVRSETDEWLAKNGIFPDYLLMRAASDHRPDHDLKKLWLDSGAIPKERVICVFDDRASVVKMWREAGLACFQVAPGDF